MKLIKTPRRLVKSRTSRMSMYEYCCSSSDDSHQAYRNFWEDSFSKYPDTEKERFKRDFQSRQDKTHIAACFELFLHEFFNRLSLDVEVHPNRPDFGNDKPDFLITTSARDQTLIEASCAFPGTEMYRRRRQKSEIVKLINDNVKSDTVRVSVSFQGLLSSEPSRKEIIEPISKIVRQWELQLVADLPSQLEVISLSIRGLELELTPRLNTQTCSAGLVTGFGDRIGHRSATQEAIRSKLDAKKKTSYATSGMPYIISLNVVEPAPLMDEEIVAALFGPEKIRFSHVDGVIRSAEFVRHYEGFWQENGRPRNTRVHAVLLFHNLGSLDFLETSPRMFLSPTAPVSSLLADVPFFKKYIWNPDNDGYKIVEATPYSSFLGFE
ncbi:MAG: hypothetical protein AB1772_11345 [Candidatus Zixiibacteriota bacterium]